VAIDPLPLPLLEIAERARREVDLLSREIGEIEVLVNQARTEASRHEQKRAQAAEKGRGSGKNAEAADEEADQLITLTKRSAIMEAQVDILEGKLKILSRFRESLRRYSSELDRASMGGAMPQHTADKLDTSTPLRRRFPGSCWQLRKTCGARSRGPCTTVRPRV